MRNFFTNTIFFTCIFLSSIAYSQSKIKGTVKDTSGQPLPGVNVVIKGTLTGSETNFDGYFEILNLSEGTYTLVASFVGYASFTKSVVLSGPELNIDIQLIEDSVTLDDVIITGVTNPKSKIESSISITTLKPNVINQSAPRTTAEIFRTIPGIRSESSGGDGNSNIAVRGVPISAGGSKYVQLQEDGLPVLLFGDIAFATPDMFTRFDSNIKSIEAIRGGSASTLSSNSPGGIINLISKTGKYNQGSVATSFGLNYDSFRTDLDYGGKISNNLYFHAGGFYRVGEGIRETGFTANNGGQFKFNLTREFEKGKIRLYTKLLNDRAVAYMPIPIQVTGTNSDPTWESAPGFDATSGALHSAYLSQNTVLDGNGNIRRADVSDGMHVKTQSIGLDIEFEIADGLKLRNNGRYSANSGRFIAPFPAQVATASTIADSFGAGSTLTYANDDSPVSANTLVNRIHMFDTELNNMNNFINDFRLSKDFDGIDLTVGYFKAIQNVATSWHWNSYLQEVSDDNARLINVSDNTGQLQSDNGLYAYGVPFWGNCCNRNYNTQYNTSAPYMNVTIKANENLTFDGGLRYDIGKVDGSIAATVQTVRDMNNDGNISVPESDVSAIDNANATPVDYDYDYASYTLGLNYKFNDKTSIFGRFSHGASAKADRIFFSGDQDFTSDNVNALDFIDQFEVGYKRKFDTGAFYATAFYSSTTEEGGFEATTNSVIENDYRSLGIELEGFYSINNFDLRGAVTYTSAEVTSGANEGNTPRRQPDLIYNLIPTYNFGKNKNHAFGLSFIGQTKAFAQDSNQLVMPGFVIVNGFFNVGVTKNLSFNLSANNIFDSLGITESEEGSITDNAVNFVRARPLPGQSFSLGVRYNL